VRTLLKVKFLAAVAILCGSVVAQAQTVRTVCDTGCTFPNTQLQSCFDALNEGDSCLLQENHTYVGSFTLPDMPGTCTGNPSEYATVRTGVTSAGAVIGAGSFPSPNIRITPTSHPNLAKIKPSSTNITQLTADINSQCYNIKWLEFVSIDSPTQAVNDAALKLGSHSTTMLETERPQYFNLEQIIVSGHPIKGMKRGISIWSRDTVLKDSYLHNLKNIGSDGQAVWAESFTNLTITNNYMSGGTETFMTGGDGGCCRPIATVQASPAPTVTSARLSTVTELFVGKGVAFMVAGVEQYTEITSISGLDVTFSPALPGVPDVPGDVDWGFINTNLVFTKNYLTRPLADRNEILPAPGNPAATCFTTGGTMAAGTYYYKVASKVLTNSDASLPAVSPISIEVNCTIASGTTGSVQISWTDVAGDEGYYVYGRAQGAQNVRFTAGTNAVSFTDTGTTGTSASPSTNGTRWNIKNTFEIKHAVGALIEGNVIENSWVASQTGYLVLFTPTTQASGNNSAVGRDITFRNNWMRSGASAFQIAGGPQSAVGGRLQNLFITNNLWTDLNGATWGTTSGRMIQITKGGTVAQAPNRCPENVTIAHNTFDNVNTGSFFFVDCWGPDHNPMPTLIYRDNIARRGIGTAGLRGTNGSGTMTEGAASWNVMIATGPSGPSDWQNNIVEGASCSTYPGGTAETICPSAATLEAGYANYAGGPFTAANFEVTSGPANNAASDATDIGANVATILAAGVTIAISGNNTGGSVQPPNILTQSLPGAIQGVPYSATLDGVCNSTPCTWSVITGTLPAGLTFNSVSSTEASITGTPTTVSSLSFTVQMADSDPSSAHDTQGYTLPVTANTAVNITTTTLPSCTVGAAYSATLAAENGEVPYTWTLNAGSTPLPPGLIVSTSGVVTGVCTTPATYTPTFRVTGQDAGFDTQQLTIVANAEVRSCGRPPGTGPNIRVEAGIYRRLTAPHNQQPDCAMIGDVWFDISQNPARPMLATGIIGTQVQWIPMLDVLATAHNLLGNNHTDTVPPGGTPAPGSLIVWSSTSGKWEVFPAGNGLLSCFNGACDWVTATTIPNIELTFMAGTHLSHGNVPAGGQEFPGAARFRKRFDLSPFSQCAMTAVLTGGSVDGANLVIQYWDGTAWQPSGISLLLGASTGTKYGAWQTIAAGAKGDLTEFRPYIDNGDGQMDPGFQSIYMTCKQ
jgi:hypothetical protein